MGIRSRIENGVELKVCVCIKKFRYLDPLFKSELIIVCFLLMLLLFQDTVMLGADFYETDAERASLLAQGKVPVGVGENSKIRYKMRN